jgi:hypothetical protein
MRHLSVDDNVLKTFELFQQMTEVKKKLGVYMAESRIFRYRPKSALGDPVV